MNYTYTGVCIYVYTYIHGKTRLKRFSVKHANCYESLDNAFKCSVNDCEPDVHFIIGCSYEIQSK